MTTSTTEAAPHSAPGFDNATAVSAMPGARVTLGRVVRSEWIKLRSLRSSWITLAAAFVAIVGFGLLAAATTSSDITGPNGASAGASSQDAVSIAMSGVTLGQLIIGVLGVMVASGEYGTGMIRATLSAVPKRLPVLWAKALVLGTVAFVTSLVAVFAAFLGAQAILGTDGVSLMDDNVLRAVIGSAVYLTGIGLLGLVLGALLRHTAGAIGALAGTILILPTLVGLLPDSWSDHITKLLPSQAGSSFMTLHTTSTDLSPWTGLAVFVVWIVAGLVGAAALLLKRDA